MVHRGKLVVQILPFNVYLTVTVDYYHVCMDVILYTVFSSIESQATRLGT